MLKANIPKKNKDKLIKELKPHIENYLKVKKEAKEQYVMKKNLAYKRLSDEIEYLAKKYPHRDYTIWRVALELQEKIGDSK